MGYKKIIACMVYLAMAAGLCGCNGKSEDTEYSEKITAKEIEIAEGTDVPEADDSEDETSEFTETAPVTTSVPGSSLSSETTVTTSKTTAASTTSKKAVTTVKKTVYVNGGGNSNKGGNAVTDAPKTTTKKTTTAATTVTEPVAPEDVDKYIDFASASSGDGYTFDGITLNIFSAGTYHLSGGLTGMVYINVSNEEKVKLRLNGVGIENTGAPCIQVENADKVTVNAVSGSSNYLKCYSTNAEGDAALFSKDDLKIKGEGSLYVFCDNEHGISCNNDLEIEGCQLTVDAEKTGITSHKTISIYSGIINTNGDNCGIRSRDYIGIEGGYVAACGGKKTGADRGGIISDTGNFCIAGGTVIAVGTNQTVPYGQNAAVFSFPEVIPKENTLAVSVNGMTLASVQPNKKFTCALISDPNLSIGALCDVWLADVWYDNFTLTDGITQAALDGMQ